MRPLISNGGALTGQPSRATIYVKIGWKLQKRIIQKSRSLRPFSTALPALWRFQWPLWNSRLRPDDRSRPPPAQPGSSEQASPALHFAVCGEGRAFPQPSHQITKIGRKSQAHTKKWVLERTDFRESSEWLPAALAALGIVFRIPRTNIPTIIRAVPQYSR